MSVSRQGVVLLAAMEDANGDFNRQKGALPRFHDNRWVRRWTRDQARLCYKRSTSWRRNLVLLSAPLAARRCAIVRNRFTMHRREPFDPSRRRLMKRTTIFLPSAI